MLLDAAFLIIWFLALVSVASASTVSTNITVDDTFGEPILGTYVTYLPAGQWETATNCTDCDMFDSTNAYDGTWHQPSFVPTEDSIPTNASVSFNGTAIYVYCILYNSYTTGSLDLQFMMDNYTLGTTIDFPTGQSVVKYDYPIYVNESIAWGPHTFTLINDHMNGSIAFAALDYIVYTTQIAPLPSYTSSIPTVTETMWKTRTSLDSQTRSIIIAVTAVGVTIVVALAICAYYLRRQRKIKYDPPEEGFFSTPPIAHGSEARWPDGQEDDWANSTASHSVASSQILLPAADESMPRNLQEASARSTVKKGRSSREASTEEYVSVSLNAVPTRPMLLPYVRQRPFMSHYRRRSAAGQINQAMVPAHRRLVVTIPKAQSLRAVVETSPPLPPTPHSGQSIFRADLSARLISEAPPVPPISSRIRSETAPQTSIFSGSTRGSVVNGSWRDTMMTCQSTAASTMTPTGITPSDFFIPHSSAPYPPARADSVKTTLMALTPNRHPDMEIPTIPSTPSFPLEGTTNSSRSTRRPADKRGSDRGRI